MEEETEVKKLRSSPSNGTDESTNQEEKKEENVLKFLDSEQNVLKFLDSMNDYLILMDSLSSKLRQGFFELASARYSMGSSRISSALFDLKYHHTATSMEMNQLDAGSDVKQPHFTLHKWASTDNEELGSKFEEDELLHQKSSSPHGNQKFRRKDQKIMDQKVLLDLHVLSTTMFKKNEQRLFQCLEFWCLLSLELPNSRLRQYWRQLKK